MSVWIEDSEMGLGNVPSAILNQLWGLFKVHGIDLRFAQRDIHIASLPQSMTNNAVLPGS